MIKFLVHTINEIDTDVKKHLVKSSITIFSLTIVYILSSSIFLSFIISAALAVLLLNWDSRFFIGVGLFFIASCPILLVFNKQNTAEEMAIYAYYMLTLGVILQIIQYFNEKSV